MEKYQVIVISVLLIGLGLGILAEVIIQWRRHNYIPPKRKRRSTWQKPQGGRHRA